MTTLPVGTEVMIKVGPYRGESGIVTRTFNNRWYHVGLDGDASNFRVFTLDEIEIVHG